MKHIEITDWGTAYYSFKGVVSELGIFSACYNERCNHYVVEDYLYGAMLSLQPEGYFVHEDKFFLAVIKYGIQFKEII